MQKLNIKKYLLENDYCKTLKIFEFFEDKTYNVKKFFRNLKIYYCILKDDEWWDFSYFEKLIIHKLKDLEKHWGKDTYYKGDCFTKGRIRVILREWEKIEKLDKDLQNVDKLKEEWFRKLGRLMPKLWD